MRRRIFSRDHAIELTRLSDPTQQLELARQIPGRLTREETRQRVDEMLGKTAKKQEPKRFGEFNDPLISGWEELMVAWTDLGMANPQKDVEAMIEELKLIENS